MSAIKIKIPKGSKGYVSMAKIKNLNPNLQIFKIRKKFNLKRKY